MECETQRCFKLNYFVLMQWFKPVSPKGTIIERPLGLIRENTVNSEPCLEPVGYLHAELLSMSPYTWQVYVERRLALCDAFEHPGLIVNIYQDVRLAEAVLAKHMFVSKFEKEKINHMLFEWLRQCC